MNNGGGHDMARSFITHSLNLILLGRKMKWMGACITYERVNTSIFQSKNLECKDDLGQ
jgi:hypothetical protein